MDQNDRDTTDISAPGVGPDLGGGASTGPESGGVSDEGEGVVAGEGAGTTGGSGPGGTGGDADTVVDPDPVDDANPETDGAG
jgi:hypothetical protein